MKLILSETEAVDILMNDEYANWTRPGAYALITFLAEIEADTDTEIALDRVALRCEYNEYASLAEFQGDYNAEDYPTIEAVERRTTVIRIPNSDGFIIEAF